RAPPSPPRRSASPPLPAWGPDLAASAPLRPTAGRAGYGARSANGPWSRVPPSFESRTSDAPTSEQPPDQGHEHELQERVEQTDEDAQGHDEDDDDDRRLLQLVPRRPGDLAE